MGSSALNSAAGVDDTIARAFLWPFVVTVSFGSRSGTPGEADLTGSSISSSYTREIQSQKRKFAMQQHTLEPASSHAYSVKWYR